MNALKPGSLALIIGARTLSGRINIGKSVCLFERYRPGERFINPVNGVETVLPVDSGCSLWLVTGDVIAFDKQPGFAFVRDEHLMPLDSDFSSSDVLERMMD
ncbi:hypothetical protein [Mangrovibacter yixingensis]|uniref:hypothetical protein n=1 Tax=Mangrovibacter yixingensis TaxID=1529639 RepID=UPI001CFAD4A4|nr:hypothetical protein [Mangrovibacter yixingensis]